MTDYCGGCGHALASGPNGGRLYCCSPAYWTHHAPQKQDVRGLFQLTGQQVRMQLWWKPEGSPMHMHHAPLYLIVPT